MTYGPKSTGLPRSALPLRAEVESGAILGGRKRVRKADQADQADQVDRVDRVGRLETRRVAALVPSCLIHEPPVPSPYPPMSLSPSSPEFSKYGSMFFNRALSPSRESRGFSTSRVSASPILGKKLAQGKKRVGSNIGKQGIPVHGCFRKRESFASNHIMVWSEGSRSQDAWRRLSRRADWIARPRDLRRSRGLAY